MAAIARWGLIFVVTDFKKCRYTPNHVVATAIYVVGAAATAAAATAAVTATFAKSDTFKSESLGHFSEVHFPFKIF